MAAACARATSIRSNIWPSRAPFPTGINSSIAISGASPSTATVYSAACGLPCWRIIRCPARLGGGAIFLRLGEGEQALGVVMMHLALGARTRTRQLAYIRERVSEFRHLVLMGDMNTHAVDLLENSPLRDLGLLAPQVEATFPSWRPQRCLDHILLSSELELGRVDVLSQPISDHLPVAVEIRLPEAQNGAQMPMLKTPSPE